MKIKKLVIIISMLLTASVFSFVTSSVASEGNIIYVDDDNTGGPWDGTPEHPYQYIQDGIDAASDGDKIYVYSGIYYENIDIKSVSIILQGENKETTIIDGGGNDDVVKIREDDVTISGFTIQHGGYNYWDDGIEVCANNITISDNIITSNDDGINMWNFRNNIIKNNIIKNNNGSGVDITGIINSIVEHNEIIHNGAGIQIEHVNNVIIKKNNVSNNEIGLKVLDCAVALWLIPSQQNRIMNNNFFNNTIHAGVYDRHGAYGSNFLCVRFFHNYWGRTMILPKIILTLKSTENPIRFPCNIDLFPALTPIQ